MADATLAITGLFKHYGALRVTDGVNLSVAPGRIHALIGPNGAGKSTLIHQICGTVRPDAGSIRLDGQEISHLPAHRRVRLGLARSFQVTSLLAESPVLENVVLALLGARASPFRFFRPLRAQADLRERGVALLERVGLRARAEAPAGALSHGEQRQLELALALAAAPKLLLLDEPLAGAGPEETERLIALLGTLRRDCAVLLVEHDMDAVFQLADEISVLAQGQVIAQGAPAAIRADRAVREAYLGEEA